MIGVGAPVVSRYERIVFEKELIAPQGQPLAAFVCPGHPLLDATLDLTIERHRDLLRRGAVLIDEGDPGVTPRILFYLEHAIQDASITRSGNRREISRQMLYVELDREGNTRHLHYAPYLDYRPLNDGEPSAEEILTHESCTWITKELEQQAISHAIESVVPKHLDEVKTRRLELVEKTRAAVKDRLTKEISYWDHRAEQLKLQEQSGKANVKLNSRQARKRADDLQSRLQKRLEHLDLEGKISARPPVVLGGSIIVPMGLVYRLAGVKPPAAHPDTQAAAARARKAVMEVERQLGFEPVDREFEKLGYDIESQDPRTGLLRFIEVKGRVTGASTITVTKNEILYSLNKPDAFILAIVEFLDNSSHTVHYVRTPFNREPDFGVTSVNYGLADLLERAEEPY